MEPWSHAFFTQQFWPHTPLELAKVLKHKAGVYQVKQVHGNIVLTPSEVEQANMLLEADGLVTEQPQQAVWVASADCTPVLIADSKTGQVAAVHAGWRGTAAKIVPQAIIRLQEQGSQLQDLQVALGPAISGLVYQVSVQVAAEVGTSIISSEADSAAELVVQNLCSLPDPPVLPDAQPGRVRLDVRRVIGLQLEHLGIGPEQVATSPHCTYQEPERFFSYRRDNLKKVQWSGIVSTPSTFQPIS